MILQGTAEKQYHIYYEFDRANRIGAGGMGTVYRGRMVDENTGAFREVAIKEVQPEGDASTRDLILDRARREASIRFHHDNIVEMLGFVETTEKKLGVEKSRYYIVSEFLDGVTLDKVLEGQFTDYQGNEIHYAKDLAERYDNDREEASLYIIKNVLAAIVTLHDNGYIHRDIDPSNIMITSEGKIKLIDFGIAKKLNALSNLDNLQSEEGAFVGKVEYAAPELVSGKVSAQNFTTDIYAIGVLFYRLLVGHLPFTGNRFDIIKAQMNKKPDIGEIESKKYRVIVAKAMEKQQKDRYQSASIMRAALDGANPAPKWAMYASVGGGCLALALLLIPLSLKNCQPIDDVIEEPEKQVDTLNDVDNPITVDDKIGIEYYLSLSSEELWSQLDTDRNNPAVLYALACTYEDRSVQDDSNARHFWKERVLGENLLVKYFDASVLTAPRELSTIRLRFVLLWLSYENVTGSDWDTPEFVAGINDLLISIPDGRKGYKLP